MKSYIIAIMAIFAILLVGCTQTQPAPVFDATTADDDSDNAQAQLEALQDLLADLEEENNDLERELSDAESTSTTTTQTQTTSDEEEEEEEVYTKAETKAKFDKFIDDEGTVSFNDLDCSNGLEDIAENFFADLGDRIEDFETSIEDGSEDDLETLEDDLSDLQSDFNDISWHADLSSSNTSITGTYPDLASINSRVTAEFNTSFTAIDAVLAKFDTAKDSLTDEDDYDKAEDDIQDIIDELDDLDSDLGRHA